MVDGGGTYMYTYVASLMILADSLLNLDCECFGRMGFEDKKTPITHIAINFFQGLGSIISRKMG